jgi:MFS family permease
MDTTTRGTASVFRSSEFRRYYAGQALSYLGDGLRTLTIPLLVFHLTGSAVSLGLTFALELLPFAAFSLLGGSLADRLDRRALMLGSDAVRFLIMALFTLALWRGVLTLPLLYVGVVLLSICAAIFLGAQASSIPYLLGKHRAKAAVAALVATEQGVNLIAPPVGGAIFGLAGALPALGINALTYLTSQLSLASVASFGPDRPSGFPSLREVGYDVSAGFRFVFADRAMRTLTLSSCAINAVAIFGFVAMIPYLKREFGATDQLVGLAFGCFALGSVAGSLLAGRTHWPFGRALVIAYVVDALAWLPVYWAQSMAVAVAAVTLCAACGAYEITTIVGWRMRVIPEDLIGRVFGVIRLLVLGGMVPGAILGGVIADHWGTRAVMGLSGVAFLLLTLGLASSRAVLSERR